jgi:uncharacterized protein involved in exopolysaccharide biosynthesis
VAFANVLLRHRGVVFGLPAAAAVVTAGVSLLVTPRFTARTTFVPEARSPSILPPGVAGLAGQLGVSLDADPSQSPRFYAQIATSREVLEQVLLTVYDDPRNSAPLGDSATLLTILEVEGRTPAESLHNGVKLLRTLVSAQVDIQTNIVTLSVESEYPSLASEVANRCVAYLNEFNASTRRSQAHERREFVAARLSEGERALRAAEDQLKRFYELNRSWQQAPQLVFEEGRLRRQVELQQELYLTLTREHETSRIDEVNDTPVITVLDRAIPPTERSYPKRKLLVFIAFTIAAGVGATWAVANDHFDRLRRSQATEYRELVGLLRVRRHTTR